VAALTYARAADTLIFSRETDVHAAERRGLEGNDRHWRGSPLDMAGNSVDPYGIKEIVIEFDNDDEDILRPKQRNEFGAYELQQLGAYLDSLAHSIRKGKKN
jgi:hypothetical protein